jgi:WD40 repeat protein
VVFSPDGKSIVSGGEKVGPTTWGEVKLWDLATGRERYTLRAGEGRITGAVFLKGGAVLATASYLGTVILWDAATGLRRASFRSREPFLHALAATPDSRALALAHGGGTSGSVSLWDVATGQERAILRGHAQPVFAVAFGPDGKLLASGSADGAVKVWDLEDPRSPVSREIATGKVEHGAVFALAFTPDGGTLASAGGTVGSRGVVTLWDVATGQQRAALEGHPDPIWCLAFRRDGRMLASGSGRPLDRRAAGEVRVWEAELPGPAP